VNRIKQPGISSAIFRFGLKGGSSRQTIPAVEKYGQHNTKSQTIVHVIRIVPVTDRATNVPLIIVERPAPKNTRHLELTPFQFN
jgi:hypothetical protein